MDILVKRDRFTKLSTGSEVFIDGTFQFYGLEPPTMPAGSAFKPRAIPAGQYAVNMAWSNRFGRDVPRVKDVPGFSGIEIHFGNFPPDTHGCLVIGKSRNTDFVGHSLVAFNELVATLEAVGGCAKIMYEDAAPAINPPAAA